MSAMRMHANQRQNPLYVLASDSVDYSLQLRRGESVPIIKEIALWLNTYGGFFSAVSVFVAVIIFLLALWSQRKRHVGNQIGLLQSLICELNYLGGKGEMQRGPIKRRSHLHWYEDSFKKGGVPTHDMRDIDVNRYIAELDERIKGKSTRYLKETLLFIHDNIVMINRWTGEFLKLTQSKDNKETKSKRANAIYVFVKQPMQRLGVLIPEAVGEINEKWFSHH